MCSARRRGLSRFGVPAVAHLGCLWGGNTVSGPPAATMSTSVRVEARVEPCEERSYGGVGRCKCSFWFAVAHDVVGVFFMMVGVFGGLVIHDLLIYAGAIVIFFSLIWWVFWYSGNIDVPPEQLEDDVGLAKPESRGLAGRVSDRFTSRVTNSFRSARGDPAGDGRPRQASDPRRGAVALHHL
ncbi:transmembrane protein 238-like [Pseudoliparis swirei]|uniref:transmembrane protein 238-like n=1 Tax=Pseudoliparis swirei TaxID=2059687 RepID=UPI0024BEC0B0|nr:transmembrane protein 238-like [Pseudoliparis swirei]